MIDKKILKGILYASISMLLVSIQPIIALARDPAIDAYFFASITCLYQAIFFIPIMLLQRRSLKKKLNISESGSNEYSQYFSLLNGWKSKKIIFILIYIGFNFAITQVLFFFAYDLAGAINGSLSQKTTILFALLFGFLLNHEKVNLKQIIFSGFLIFGVILATTQGQFNLLEINIGVILMIIVSILWMLAHAVIKPTLKENQLISSQIVFIRNLLNALILISTYFLFFPTTNFKLLFDPANQFFFIFMSINYSIDLFCWYLSLKYLDVSKATIIIAPTPILTAIISTILFGELFTLWHLLGTIIIVISIIIIMWEKGEKTKGE
ncbi:MAG: EamA family transporter [Candidatus Lokiarchaeota archaeon]|nr:EamA family transporter [Candidatus Lokiarchaeota archaeon]MBD3198961.1 EamA family transporter [Candidatus Lokiarchaeota archaeon]